MNLNATPETVRALTQVFKFAGILDDKFGQPDKARIAAWSEQVQRHGLTECDLFDGLQAFYDQPQERAIGIGDLVHHARAAKRARTEREDDTTREDRRSAADRKAARDETGAVFAGFIGGPVAHKTDRLTKAENGLQCAVDKATAMAAIREYFAAKRESQGRRPVAVAGG